MNSQLTKVVEYYNQTKLEYELFWTGKKDLAIHFGYCDSTTKSHQQSLLKMNEVLARFIGITNSDYILDAGCGYGGSAFWLAENIGCQVKGINIVPFQIKKANQEAKERGLFGKVDFEYSDFTNTQFKENTFTVVWALESLVHTSEKEKFIKEAARILKPKGRILIAEYTLPDDKQPQDKADLLQSALNGWAMEQFVTARQIKECLAQNGFSDIQTHDLSEFIAPSINRLGKLSYLPTTSIRLIEPLLKGLANMGVLSKVRSENLIGGYNQTRAFNQGLWKYSVITATKHTTS